MKHLITLAALLGSTSAYAQESGLKAYDFGLSYAQTNSDSGDYNAQRLNALIDLEVMPWLGVQLEFGAFKESEETAFVPTIAAHIYYTMDSGFSVGALVGAEVWDDDQYVFSGLEGAYSNDKLRVDAFFMDYYESDARAYYQVNIAGLGAEYALTDNISLLGGYTKESGDYQGSATYLGGKYAFENGFYLSAKYFADDDGGYKGNTVRLDIGKQFGKTTFGNRSWNSLMPGFD
jgi:hypothetical protein